MQYTLFMILAPLAAVASVVAAIYCWRHRTAPGALALLWAMIAVTGWLVFNILELADPTENGTVLWATVEYPFLTSASALWLAFALQYTGQGKWLSPARLAVLFVIPLMTSVFVLTNNWHHLIWKRYAFTPVGDWLAMNVVTYGPWFWVQITYSYLTVLTGAFVIVREYFQSWNLYRQQSAWSVIGAIGPLVFNIVYVFHLIPGFRKDYSSVAYAMSGLAFSIAIFRYYLFDLMPVARKALVDEMSDGMLVVDARGRVVDMNLAAQSALGLSAVETIGQPITHVLHSWENMDSSLVDKTEIRLGQDEGQRYYDMRISLLREQHGQLTGRLVVLRDITERRNMEQALRRANLELVARNEELDAFGHTVAHDLKGPLSVVIGQALLLTDKESALSEEQRHEASRAIAEVGFKLNNILEELMLLAGLRKERVEMRPLDMASIVAETAKRQSRMITQYQAVVEWPDAATWPTALGHAPWVEEVWANYLSNAIKYGGRPPHVQVGARLTGNSAACFWVRDNGAGLSPEEQARLFVPFERLEQARVSGHGLGLSIVRRIVERMGGQVGVESEGATGHGSMFYFTLPLAGS
jgi:PAS domain S-box-containing protein